MTYCFVFVCQSGELELKSTLLAASLARHLRCSHELVAAVPAPESIWGAISTPTRALLDRLGVRIAPIVNPIDPSYPIGNKLACLSIETSADKIVFLDSDMLCLRDFHGDPRFEQFAANLKPADLAIIGAEVSRWAAACAACGVPSATGTVHATVTGEPMPPYFNAGFIAVHRDAGVGPAWVDCARRIDADPAIPDKRPWLDQIALPVALSSLGITPDCLDERFNFPAHLKPIDPADPPWFVHYHTPDVIRAEPRVNALVQELSKEHPELRDALAANPAWQGLLRPVAAPDRPGPDLIVTGIPRSGTSYLCKLVHGIGDCVVVNEPAGIFGPLAGQPVPWGVAMLHRDLRRDIRDGTPIANKLHNGEFIEDTAAVDTVEQYVPRVGRPDFLLGTKNTLAYLARLPQLGRAMPAARIVACVRHPLDTIASWKTTFPHLARADLESQVVGHSRDAQLSDVQRERLRAIASTVDLAQKRALAWRHLAMILLEHRERIELVRYEDLVADPGAALRRVFDSTPRMFAHELPAAIAPSSPRHKRDALDDEDREAIRRICWPTAAQFGYAMD